MNPVIERFAAECHDILKRDPGPAGREEVRARLESVLTEESVLSDYFGPDADSQRNILYEDPELKFCIIAHVYNDARISKPHDHADSWAIYGQVDGVTHMTEYQPVDQPAEGKPGTAEPEKTYDLKPGMAVGYEPGVLHAPVRHGPTKLLRIEGKNLAGVKRDRYEEVA